MIIFPFYKNKCPVCYQQLIKSEAMVWSGFIFECPDNCYLLNIDDRKRKLAIFILPNYKLLFIDNKTLVFPYTKGGSNINFGVKFIIPGYFPLDLTDLQYSQERLLKLINFL